MHSAPPPIVTSIFTVCSQFAELSLAQCTNVPTLHRNRLSAHEVGTSGSAFRARFASEMLSLGILSRWRKASRGARAFFTLGRVSDYFARPLRWRHFPEILASGVG